MKYNVLFGYPGGKTKISKEVLKYFPEHVGEYREPFFGGGGMYIALLNSGIPFDYAWINDIDKNLINFWQRVKADWKTVWDIVMQYKAMPFDDAIADARSCFDKQNFQAAGAWLFLEQCSFSSMFNQRPSKFIRDQNLSDGKWKKYEKLSPMLPDKITSLDYSELLRAPGEDVFIFLDPPYTQAERFNLYAHSKMDFDRFVSELRNCKHRWIMTLDFYEPFKDFADAIELDSLSTMFNGKNHLFKEYIIRSK